MFLGAWAWAWRPARKAEFEAAARLPLEDIAHAVMFLASEHAGWITGETLGVDGGK